MGSHETKAPMATWHGLTITGTDTDVGKTVVAASIVEKLLRDGTAAGVYKPVCSGAEISDGQRHWTDVETHFAALGERFDRERIAPQCFDAPLAPPLAAQLEGRDVEWDIIQSGFDWWRDQCEFLVVEGAGGLLCPITHDRSFADVAAAVGFPVLVVSRATLGTVNHTLLTIEVARQHGLNVAGVVLNMTSPSESQEAARSNVRLIADRTSVPVLGIHPWSGAGQLLEGSQMQTLDGLSIAGISESH